MENTFRDLKLIEPLVESVKLQGYDTPSPIQQKAIPVILEGEDILAAAQTGTGKTAAFCLPILQHLYTRQASAKKGNQIRALVLTPTRELAAQVANNAVNYGDNLKLKSVVVFGGVKINPQMQKLRGGADILVATPGRLLDLYQNNAIKFDALEILVLDEADRMLDMGFIHDIRRIIKMLPRQRQTLLFSATFSSHIRELAQQFLKTPVEISISPANSTVDTVKQSLIGVEKTDKARVLMQLIEQGDWFQVLVFTRTKHGANKLVKKLNTQNMQSAAIHGNKSQGARTRALEDFKQGKCRVLVATDIAARGIDINHLPHVINFDLPQVAEDYVHRIGRTGRAGADGEAISLVSHDEFKLLQQIERLIKKPIPRKSIEGYEPLNQLPVSSIPKTQKNIKHNKAKQNKKKVTSKKSVTVSQNQKASANSRRKKRATQFNKSAKKTKPAVTGNQK